MSACRVIKYIFRAFRRGDNDPKKDTDVEMKEEVKEEKVEDKIKNDVVINSSLERTRRLLKSRTKVEAGTAIKQDPAAKLRDRLKKIKEMKEAKVTFDICLIFHTMTSFLASILCAQNC